MLPPVPRLTFFNALALALALAHASAIVSTTDAQAESLEPLKIRLPADPALVRARCDVAFQQALLDKQTYESQPHVNLTCAFTIRPEILNQMQRSFTVMCLNTFDVHVRQASEYRVTLEPEVLQRAFNEVYGYVFRRDCLDKSVSQFTARNAAKTQPARTAPVRCQGRDCQSPMANR